MFHFHRIGAIAATLALSATGAEQSFDYRVLATSKTSTMEKELNGAAADGYRFSRVMGGKVVNGGQVIIAMVKDPVGSGHGVRKYRLLATSKTSTMQAEMQQLADAGYSYVDHTVFESAAGGKEIAVIMELDSSRAGPSSYRLLATTRTSTMQQELQDAGSQGYALLGFASGKTSTGSEVIAILRKDR
jgi:hypothetical protein